jgi:hypothetical protein
MQGKLLLLAPAAAEGVIGSSSEGSSSSPLPSSSSSKSRSSSKMFCVTRRFAQTHPEIAPTAATAQDREMMHENKAGRKYSAKICDRDCV